MEIDYQYIIHQIETNYFVQLSEDCRQDLIQSIKIKPLEKHTLLIKEGQYTNTIYFVVKGCARAYYLKDGKEITDWFAFENDFITSINGYFLSIPSPYSIELLESAIIIEFSRETINQLTQKHHDFTQLEKAIVTKTMLQLQERVVSIQFRTAQEKYLSLLELYPSITQRVSLTQIASYLGITLETLSRIRNSKT